MVKSAKLNINLRFKSVSFNLVLNTDAHQLYIVNVCRQHVFNNLKHCYLFMNSGECKWKCRSK